MTPLLAVILVACAASPASAGSLEAQLAPFDLTADDGREIVAAVEERVPSEFFGLVADELLWGGSRPATFSTAAGMGVGTIRQPFDWALVEEQRGLYDWSVYDAYVADAALAGLSVLPILFNPPHFHSSRPRRSKAHGTFPPKGNAAFAEFAKRAVERYGPRGSFWDERPELPRTPLRSWQIWNEPNLGVYWRPRPDPVAYTTMLRAVGWAIHRADPGAEVVAAGLPQSKLGMPMGRFIRKMYDAGAQGTFDTLAVHPYASDADGVYKIVQRVRKVLDANRDRRKKLWVSEIGWATGGPENPFNVGERAQAALIRRTLGMLVAYSEPLKLRGVVYYNWRDLPRVFPARDRWGLHSGLLRRDGTQKAGFTAFTETVRALTVD